MANLLNQGQPLRRNVLDPVSSYSRLVGVELRIPAGIGSDDYCVTPQLGNRLVLNAIHFHGECPVLNTVVGGFVYLMFGSGIPAGSGDVADRWNHIIELHCGVKKAMRIVFVERLDLCWPMRRRFIYDEIRFGVVMENFGLTAWYATVLFEIMEG